MSPGLIVAVIVALAAQVYIDKFSFYLRQSKAFTAVSTVIYFALLIGALWY